MTTKLGKTLLAAALALLPACGGGGGSSGVSGSKAVSTINDSEKGMLCDWFAGQVGGYGAVDACPTFGLEAPPSKETCVAEFPVCAVTVAQFEDCVQTILAAEATCTTDAFTTAQMNANCQAVGAAGCFE